MINGSTFSRSRRNGGLALAAFAAAFVFALLAWGAQPAYADDLQSGSIGDALESSGPVLDTQASGDTSDITIWGTYGQTSARSITAMVNDFRKSSDAWAWNESNTEKVSYTGLGDLTYDYALEKAAMQRAAEIALSFSHTRPDGTSCFTAISENGSYSAMGENIAYGYQTAESAFVGWREDDDDYDGQGHRRNMLSSSFTAMGVGHVVVNGSHYWVQEFGSPVSNTAETAADDSSRDITLSAATANLTIAGAEAAYDETTIAIGDEVDLPAVTATVSMSGPQLAATLSLGNWASADSSVAAVEDGKLVGKGIGNTTVTAALPNGGNVSVAVSVKASIAGAEVSFSPANYVYSGAAITPKPTVSKDGTRLAENTDYTLEYSGNVNVGTATVTVRGIGNYANSAQGTFQITPASLSSANVTILSPQRYTGKALMPSLTVMYGNKALQVGTDYAAAYSNNVAIGTAKVALTGRGNFTGSTSATFEIAEIPASWNRLAGPIALDTMSEIVAEGWKGQTGGTVVLTTADGYWDALTAAGIAGMAKAPVLMTDGTSLSSQTEEAIKTYAPTTIVVCGGTAAVTDGVAEVAVEAAGGAKLVRCWGQTATGTAVDVFNTASSESMGAWSDIAFVCTNGGYWDALAAAPISYSKAMPIFLTESDSAISDETLSAMKDGGIRGVYIVGGTAAITDDVRDAIEGAGITVVDRLWGATAVETSEAVAKYGLEKGMNCAKMGVATTNGYWDALAGAPLCGLNDSVIVLAGDAGASSITGFVASNKADIGEAYVFGGEAAVDADTYQALVDAIS